jgi:hypothetical protein
MNRLAIGIVLVPLLAVGLVSFIFVRARQGDGALLVANQQHAQTLTPGAVARVVKAAPESVGGPPGNWARCISLGSGLLYNPWRCSIGYRSGHVIQYRVTINSSGSYTGDHQVDHYHGHIYHASARISGCCVPTP